MDMNLPYRMEVFKDMQEGCNTVSYPDLRGCLTYAEMIETVMKNAKEVKIAWLETAIEEGCEIPEPDDLDKYSGQKIHL